MASQPKAAWDALIEACRPVTIIADVPPGDTLSIRLGIGEWRDAESEWGRCRDSQVVGGLDPHSA